MSELRRIWLIPLGAKLNAALWFYLFGVTALALASSPAWGPRLLLLWIFAPLFGCLAFASLRGSIWPLLASILYTVPMTATAIQHPHLLATRQSHALWVFAVVVAVSVPEWRKLSWRLFGASRQSAPSGGASWIRAVFTRLREAPGQVTAAALLIGLGLGAFLMLLISAAGRIGTLPALAIISLLVVILGFAGAVLLVSLFRMSRWATLILLGVAALPAALRLRAAQTDVATGILFGVALLLAGLLLPLWPQMTWRFFGTEGPTRRETVQAFS